MVQSTSLKLPTNADQFLKITVLWTDDAEKVLFYFVGEKFSKEEHLLTKKHPRRQTPLQPFFPFKKCLFVPAVRAAAISKVGHQQLKTFKRLKKCQPGIYPQKTQIFKYNVNEIRPLCSNCHSTQWHWPHTLDWGDWLDWRYTLSSRNSGFKKKPSKLAFQNAP